MSAPPKPKQGSRWGSLLSGAVAGIESRLDTILAEEEGASAKSRAADGAAREPAASQGQPEQDLSRSSSRARNTNARLQDRLAKAMVKASEGRQSSELPSRAESPALGADTARTSLDSKATDVLLTTSLPGDGEKLEGDTETGFDRKQVSEELAKSEVDGPLKVDKAENVPSLDVPAVVSPRASLDSARSKVSLDNPTTGPDDVAEPDARPSLDRDPSALEEEITRLRSSYDELSKSHREETHEHLERIDALQAKLKYLAESAASEAKTNANNAPAGSTEQKLAEKDERIALLMEEGQKLSKAELKHLSNIKKLRAKVGEDEKRIAELTRKLAKSEATMDELTERTRRAEATAKAAQQQCKQLEKVEKSFESVKTERDASNRTIADLRRQLAEANVKAEDAEKRAQTNAVEAERKLVTELKDDLSNAQREKKLADERAKAEVKDAREEADRQKEKANAMEMELRGEISNLENKLEYLRSRTEEASSGSTGDSQIKLLRQIETLQTQYALASENWQGIETTLTSRVAALEKERDEISRREGDIRRKAREVNSKSRRLEDELESTCDKARSLEHELESQKSQMHKLQSRLAQTEASLEEARRGFEQQKKAWDAELQQRIDDEKTKWRLETHSNAPMSPTEQYLRPDTPSAPGSLRKLSGPELMGLQSRRGVGRAISNELLVSSTERRDSARRPSGFPPRSPGIMTPVRQDSTSSLSQLNGGSGSGGGVVAPTPPSIHTIDNDEAFEHTSSPHRTVADMISVSTVGAGPSVQLVERMSAAVRRLESEKAVSKEEMSRLAAQRDEAREEVVALMREVDGKRSTDQKVAQLEKELQAVNERYQATLEMLGEKSEQVEELTNDVEDLKKIYRDLVERTMN